MTYANLGSFEIAGYPNGLPNLGTYLGTLKNKSIKIIDNVVMLINNQANKQSKLPNIIWFQSLELRKK